MCAVMRIHDLNLTGSAAAETGKAQASEAVEKEISSRASATHAGSGTDSVDFSPLSRAISSNASSCSARVAQLTAQYRAGQYQVNPGRLSSAMVGESLAASASSRCAIVGGLKLPASMPTLWGLCEVCRWNSKPLQYRFLGAKATPRTKVG